jgi:UrcA family protein
VKTANRFILSTAILVASVWIGSGASAEQPFRTETVKFQDLNVSTSAGARALYSRIHAAAKHVCEQTDPVMRLAVSACVSKAEVSAIQSLSLPQLTAFYREKTGNQSQPLIAQR